MLNFNRQDRPADAKDSGKFALKPALYEPPVHNNPAAATAGRAPAPAAPSRDGTAAPAGAAREVPATPAPAPAVASAPMSQVGEAAPGSKLAIGINIKLRGVEISDCDVLVIEGHVEATVHSKMMEIAKPGTLSGTAHIDIAEIHGDFSGELTARTRLVVHGTGRVSGTIRYGKLVVAEGGELSGDIKRMDDAEAPASARPELRPGATTANGARSA